MSYLQVYFYNDVGRQFILFICVVFMPLHNLWKRLKQVSNIYCQQQECDQSRTSSMWLENIYIYKYLMVKLINDMLIFSSFHQIKLYKNDFVE